MKTMALVTPIGKSKISNLRFSEYILIYLDKNNKLKRAIPDFDEAYIDSDTSLLCEALNSEKVAAFSYVPWRYKSAVNKPIFNVYINDSGEIIKYDNYSETSVTELENFLLDSKTRQRMLKSLKKNI